MVFWGIWPTLLQCFRKKYHLLNSHACTSSQAVPDVKRHLIDRLNIFLSVESFPQLDMFSVHVCRRWLVRTDVLMSQASLSGSRARYCVPLLKVIGCCLKISTVHRWTLCPFLFHCLRPAHSQCLAMVVKWGQRRALESLQPEGYGSALFLYLCLYHTIL